MDEKFPLFLRPAVKDYLWGGERLKTEYGKSYVDISPLAECWECSTHPDGVSTIDGGEFDGMGLDEVIRHHPEYLGTKFEGLKELPILVKLIDAKDKLSVQVHPDDEYAFLHEHGSKGKTEMWYILDTCPNAEIIYGVKDNVGIKEIQRGLLEGTIEKYLNHMRTYKDEVYMITPGTIHAIGAGNVIAEIQENSNITYRLYDYDRRDKKGLARELHIQKALDVIKINANIVIQPMRVLKYQRGCALEVLLRSSLFEVSRVIINTKEKKTVKTTKEFYKILLCIEGVAILNQRIIKKGQCVFIPAGVNFFIRGNATMLSVTG